MARLVRPEDQVNMSSKIPNPSEVTKDNIQEITVDLLEGENKAEYDVCMAEYGRLLMNSFGRTRDGAVKKAPLPRPQQIIIQANPGRLQDMMTEAMHKSLIDQASVFNNSVQNCVKEVLREEIMSGFKGPAYYQPNRNPTSSPNSKFTEFSSAFQLI